MENRNSLVLRTCTCTIISNKKLINIFKKLSKPIVCSRVRIEAIFGYRFFRFNKFHDDHGNIVSRFSSICFLHERPCSEMCFLLFVFHIIASLLIFKSIPQTITGDDYEAREISKKSTLIKKNCIESSNLLKFLKFECPNFRVRNDDFFQLQRIVANCSRRC